MTRPAVLLLTLVLLVGTVSALPAASAATSSFSASSTALQPDANVTPGQRLAGVLGAGQAEFEGDIERRAFAVEYALAATNGTKAAVVKDRLDRAQERLDELEARREALEAARANGSMSEGEYRARVTALAARSQQVEQLAVASETRANRLPADVLESKGIDLTAIRTLQADAANLSGEAVAEIARSIAGPAVGEPVTRGPPIDVGKAPDGVPGDGPPAGDGNGTDDGEAEAALDRAQGRIATAEERLQQANEHVGANASDNATAAIDQAEVELERAQSALDRAQAALEAGNSDAALERAQDALVHAEQAEAHAQAALDAATGRDRGTDRPGDS